MRAVRVTQPGTIEVADVPEPSDAGLVRVRVHGVGICGTDVKIVSGEIPVDYPRVIGHEMTGEVVAAPPGSPFVEGTRVLVDPGVSCGWCDLCLSGRPHLCRNGGLMGRDIDGVFTDYVEVPWSRLIPVPPTLSGKAAGLLQVLGTCVHAVRQLDVFPGQVTAVIGLGVAGQLLAQLLGQQGARVVGITRSEWKRHLATESGAAAVAGPSDAATVVDDLTDGRGPELVVEAVGSEATLARAIDLVSIGGTVLAYGTITEGDRGLPYYELYHKELTLRSPRAALIGDYSDGVALAASGALHLEPIVTHELDVTEAARAFELVHDPDSLKVLMRLA